MQKNLKDKILLIFSIAIFFGILFIPSISALNIDYKNRIISFNEPELSENNFEGYININIAETWELLTNTSNGIHIPIDVRKNYEWIEKRIDTPVPENPRHYCLDLLQDPKMLVQFMSLYDGKDVIIYCRSGGRSVTASNILINYGFNGTVYNMVGGINAWIDAEYPVLSDGITNISVEEAYELLTDTANGIQTPIDVRTLNEWLSGFINTPYPENASHHPLSDLQDVEKLQEFLELYEGRELIIYCHSGVRSFMAAEILVENEFTGTIYNMLGGIVAWRNAGYPVKILEPLLECTGSLTWNNVDPGSLLQTSLSVQNIGDSGSFLDWRIESYPEWGNWSFEPSDGLDLPTGNITSVVVNVTAPEDIGTVFNGEVKIVNMENASNVVTLQVHLNTPRTRQINNNFILRIFKLFPNILPIIRYLLRL
jgi:rhodanese-related sulfurtransferase